MVSPFLTSKDAQGARIKLSLMGCSRKEQNELLSNYLERSIDSFSQVTVKEMLGFWGSAAYQELVVKSQGEKDTAQAHPKITQEKQAGNSLR